MVATRTKPASSQKKTSRTQRAKQAVKQTVVKAVNNLLPDDEQQAEAYVATSQLVHEPDFNLAPKQTASTSALDFSRLPLNLSANLPDFTPLTNVTDLSNPASFEAAGYGRVTNNERELNKIQYGEHKNYIDNISDGLDVMLSTFKAAIKSAKIGQEQVRYATAREGINTELNNLGIQQSKTRQGALKLDAEIGKETHLTSVNETNKSILSVQIDDLKLTLQEQEQKYLTRQQSLAALIGSNPVSV
jgi:hypothetical protein